MHHRYYRSRFLPPPVLFERARLFSADHRTGEYFHALYLSAPSTSNEVAKSILPKSRETSQPVVRSPSLLAIQRANVSVLLFNFARNGVPSLQRRNRKTEKTTTRCHNNVAAAARKPTWLFTTRRPSGRRRGTWGGARKKRIRPGIRRIPSSLRGIYRFANVLISNRLWDTRESKFWQSQFFHFVQIFRLTLSRWFLLIVQKLRWGWNGWKLLWGKLIRDKSFQLTLYRPNIWEAVNCMKLETWLHIQKEYCCKNHNFTYNRLY